MTPEIRLVREIVQDWTTEVTGMKYHTRYGISTREYWQRRV